MYNHKKYLNWDAVFFRSFVLLILAMNASAENSKLSQKEINEAIMYAQYAEAAYKSPDVVNDHAKIMSASTNSGLQASAYQSGNNIIVTFAGTNPQSTADIVTNLHAVSPISLPSQFKDAKQFLDSVKEAHPNSDVAVTGHSLGGQIARYVGELNGFRSIVFNAPPINSRMNIENVLGGHSSQSSVNAESKSYVTRYTDVRNNFWGMDIAHNLMTSIHGGQHKPIYIPVERPLSDFPKGMRVQQLLHLHSIDTMINGLSGINNYDPQELHDIHLRWQSYDALVINNLGVPGIDFENQTTLQGASPPMKLPNVDFKNNKTVGGASEPLDLPNIDFQNNTTTGGGAIPFELPGIDFKNGTTTGGGGPPIPIPQIPMFEYNPE